MTVALYITDKENVYVCSILDNLKIFSYDFSYLFDRYDAIRFQVQSICLFKLNVQLFCDLMQS